MSDPTAVASTSSEISANVLGHIARIYTVVVQSSSQPASVATDEGETAVMPLEAALPYMVWKRPLTGRHLDSANDTLMIEKLSNLLSQPKRLFHRHWSEARYGAWPVGPVSRRGEVIAKASFDPLRSWVGTTTGGTVTLTNIGCGVLILAEVAEGVTVSPNTEKFQLQNPAEVARALIKAQSTAGESTAHTLAEGSADASGEWRLGSHKVNYLSQGTSVEEGAMNIKVMMNGRITFDVISGTGGTDSKSH